MQAHNNNISEFLGMQKTMFVVPVYQRNYDWLDTNCQQLFSDILKTILKNKPHFLGTICFKSNNAHEKSIIDGQQRLTSITLMLRALQEVAEGEELKKEISDSYLRNKGIGIDTEYMKVKLHLNERDDEVYRIILNDSFSNAKNKLNPIQKESRLFQNYKLFIKLVSDYLEKNKNGAAYLIESLNLLTIIELEIQNENPQEIFESLNSTGLDLTNVDLLRNYLLMQFAHEEQSSLYQDYWSKIEDAVGVDNMDEFFVDYLIVKKRSDAISVSGRRAHISEKNLYFAFKDYYSSYPIKDNYEKTRAIFADMKYYAELYRTTVFHADAIIESETSIRKKLYSLLEINEATKSRCLILDLLDKQYKKFISEKDLEEAIVAISSYSFRSKICNGKGFSRQFAGNIMIRLDQLQTFENFVDDFWTAMTFGKGESAFPNDEDFKYALATKDMYLALRSKGTKYLLYSLEENSPYPKGLPNFNDSTISIEHIMPQTLNPKWKSYLGAADSNDYLNSLHHLGNLALTSYNPEMSNKDFTKKQEIYAASNFYFTKELTKVVKWDLSAIDKRGKELADLAVKIWPLPKNHQTAKSNHETLHMMDEDYSMFSFTKPSTIYFDDEEIAIANWAEFLPAICKKLLNIDEEALLEAINPLKVRAFVRDDDNHKYSDNEDYTCIIDDIYYNNKKSAYSTLELTGKLLKEFDNKAGTSLYGTLMFALK